MRPLRSPSQNHVGDYRTVLGNILCSSPAVMRLELRAQHDVIDPHPRSTKPGESLPEKEVAVCIAVALSSFGKGIVKPRFPKRCARERSVRRVQIAGDHNRFPLLPDQFP